MDFFMRSGCTLLVTAACCFTGGCGGSDTYTVGGLVEGLNGVLSITLNSDESLDIISSGEFAFGNALSAGTPYEVSIVNQPEMQTCEVVESKSGSGDSGNVTGVLIRCIDSTLSQKVLIDQDGDNVSDLVFSRLYDSEGHLVHETSKEQRVLLSYNEEGDLIKKITKDSLDRIIASEEYVYGSYGVISEIYKSDGESTRIVKHFYDDFGFKVTSQIDVGDQMNAIVVHYSYDSGGRLRYKIIDQGGDLLFDESVSYEYDAFGNNTKVQFDDNYDGSIDRSIFYFYDEFENIVSEIHDDKTIAYTYDALNRIIRIQVDNGNNGSFEEMTDLAYLETGQLTRVITDLNGDGIIDSMTEYQYEGDLRININ